mgnify:CR=1 FL=1
MKRCGSSVEQCRETGIEMRVNGELIHLSSMGRYDPDEGRGRLGPSSSHLHQLTGEPLTDEPSFVIVYSIT